MGHGRIRKYRSSASLGTGARDQDHHQHRGGLSRDGRDAILKVVKYVGAQPAQGIADIAKEVGADVIVIGTRGHSAIGGLVLGSVT